MPLWGNTDRANNEPNFPENREVRPVATLITANATALGTNEIIFTTNPTLSGIANGMYVYATANNGLSRFFDTSIIDPNDIDFKRSNNRVAVIRTGAANVRIQFANNTVQVGASIPLANLKVLLAASTDFNDFKSRIAAL